MTDDRQRGTNAADSAPGVDDGRARNARPQHFTQPRGRGKVWIGVAVVLLLLLVIFIARPFGAGGEGPPVSEMAPGPVPPAEAPAAP